MVSTCRYTVIMIGNAVIPLPEVIGCHLLTYLYGTDAINFVEAINNTDQFGSIAQTSDHHALALMAFEN